MSLSLQVVRVCAHARHVSVRTNGEGLLLSRLHGPQGEAHVCCVLPASFQTRGVTFTWWLGGLVRVKQHKGVTQIISRGARSHPGTRSQACVERCWNRCPGTCPFPLARPGAAALSQGALVDLATLSSKWGRLRVVVPTACEIMAGYLLGALRLVKEGCAQRQNRCPSQRRQPNG